MSQASTTTRPSSEASVCRGSQDGRQSAHAGVQQIIVLPALARSGTADVDPLGLHTMCHHLCQRLLHGLLVRGPHVHCRRRCQGWGLHAHFSCLRAHRNQKIRLSRGAAHCTSGTVCSSLWTVTMHNKLLIAHTICEWSETTMHLLSAGNGARGGGGGGGGHCGPKFNGAGGLSRRGVPAGGEGGLQVGPRHAAGAGGAAQHQWRRQLCALHATTTNSVLIVHKVARSELWWRRYIKYRHRIQSVQFAPVCSVAATLTG